MSINNGNIIIPEELRSRFEESDDLVFKDGSIVTAAEVWRFMTEDAPRRFPYTFDTNLKNQFSSRISPDFELFTGLKHNYLTLTLRERLINAHNNGIPIVLLQPFQSSEPYHAAGVIPLRTGTALYLAQNRKEGLNIKQFNLERKLFLEAGRTKISIDACSPQLSSFAVLQEAAIPVDFVAPNLCTRCSDIAYLCELYRSSNRSYPSFLIDYPVNGQGNKEWAATYLASTLRRLTKKLSELSKIEFSEEELKKEIKLENQARKLLREYMELWWSAKVPPTNSIDHMSMPRMCTDSLPDTILGINLAKETIKEVKRRIKHSIKGTRLADDPVRIFGSGGGLNSSIVDKAGGVMVGSDDQWSQGSVLIKETGDSYENLATAYLSYPHEKPLEERGLWVAEQVKKSKADGVIFRYQWGCNNQSAVSRIILDIVKAETGLPTLIIEQSERDTSEASEQLTTRAEAFIEMLK